MDLAAIRAGIDRVLARHLDQKRARLGRSVEPLVDATAELTRRGGKRLRPAIVFAGHAAVAPIEDMEALTEAAAAFELLQTYLLIQDDWMDEDDTRRGGPSVHAMLRRQIAPAHRADSVALLASDLACSDAWAMLIRARFPADRVLSALAAFGAMHEEVVLGQYLDVIGSADLERVHLWKTAGYTVRWPVAIGAILGGGSSAQRAALEAWARPIGLAFQTRDDVLGTFGDPGVTGKPAGNDLRQGKETRVLERARSSPSAWAVIAPMLGKADADVVPAIAALEEAGVRDAIEAEITDRVAMAREALVGAGLRAEGVEALMALAGSLTSRDA